jgi:hypothetical protein
MINLDLLDDVSSAHSDDDKKKQAPAVVTRSSFVSHLWQRAQSSLVPSRTSLQLPRYYYDVRSYVRTNHSSVDAREEEEEEVQLIALSPSASSSDLDSSSDSLESAAPPSSASTSSNGPPEQVLLFEEGASAPRHAWILRRRATKLRLPPAVDVQAYMARRSMTKLQERCNALTVLPAPLYCLYYVLAALWIPPALVHHLREEVQTTGVAWPDTWVGEPSACHVAAAAATDAYSWGSSSSNRWASSCLLPPSWPPATILAIAAGVILHAPWSVLYHWTYAHALPAGVARTTHWSRRMDQAMLHLFCTSAAYGTSGSWDYMMASALFNADSAYRHFTPKVAPRRNKARLTLAIIAYSLPMVGGSNSNISNNNGDASLFLQFWATMSVSMWLFATYPLGGWSHAIFHIVVTAILPLLFQAATLTASSQAAIHLAAQCTVWQQQQQPSHSWLLAA